MFQELLHLELPNMQKRGNHPFDHSHVKPVIRVLDGCSGSVPELGIVLPKDSRNTNPTHSRKTFRAARRVEQAIGLPSRRNRLLHSLLFIAFGGHKNRQECLCHHSGQALRKTHRYPVDSEWGGQFACPGVKQCRRAGETPTPLSF
ncbi:MAG: hypothetical protein ACR2NN_19810 [Bryobacteraceae bacterium]